MSDRAKVIELLTARRQLASTCRLRGGGVDPEPGWTATLDIAKAVVGSGARASDVNSLLYQMLKEGVLERRAADNGGQPRWRLVLQTPSDVSASVSTTTTTPSSSTSAHPPTAPVPSVEAVADSLTGLSLIPGLPTPPTERPPIV